MAGCRCATDCRCGMFTALDLSSATCMPVAEVLGVMVNGAPWAGTFRLVTMPCDSGGPARPTLILDGPVGAPGFPAQHLGRTLDQDGTWAIVARTGVDPLPAVLRQTEQLAYEILKADGCDPENSQLADGVVSMSRKGMTVNFDTKRTGLPVLDQLIDKWKCKPNDFERGWSPVEPVTWMGEWLGLESALGAAATAGGWVYTAGP